MKKKTIKIKKGKKVFTSATKKPKGKKYQTILPKEERRTLLLDVRSLSERQCLLMFYKYLIKEVNIKIIEKDYELFKKKVDKAEKEFIKWANK